MSIRSVLLWLNTDRFGEPILEVEVTEDDGNEERSSISLRELKSALDSLAPAPEEKE